MKGVHFFGGRSGQIKKALALLTPASSAALETRGIRAYVQIQIKGGSHEDILNKLSNMPNAQRVELTWGNYDFMVELSTQDVDDLQRTLEKISHLPGVARTETHIVGIGLVPLGEEKPKKRVHRIANKPGSR